MASRHRFLQRSIKHVDFHNRLTEEDAMWRLRENERQRNHGQRRDRSRSPRQKKRKRRSSSSSSVDESKKQVINNQQTDGEFGPPLPTNLGMNADRWDHAFFMQRYPKDYEKQIKNSKRRESTSSSESENEKKKQKHSKHDRKRKVKEGHKKKTKRRHRSKSE